MSRHCDSQDRGLPSLSYEVTRELSEGRPDLVQNAG